MPRRARRPRTGLTRRGLALVLLGVALLTAGVVLRQRDLTRVGMFIVVLPGVSLAVLALPRPRLEVYRSPAGHRAEVGRPTPVTLQVHNRGRATGPLLLMDGTPRHTGDPGRFPLTGMQAGEHRRLVHTLYPTRRGRVRLGPTQMGVIDPLGLAVVVRRVGPASDILVHPRAADLPARAMAAATGTDDGPGVSSTAGPSLSLREYRQGDDLRRVHWRSTARLGELMVRGDEPSSRVRIGVLLDNRPGAHPGGVAAYEQAISLAAGVCARLQGTSHDVILVTQDSAGAVLTVESDHLDVLAELDPAPDTAPLAPGPLAAMGTITAVLGRPRPADLAALDTLTGRRLALLTGRHDRTAQRLQTNGWEVLEAAPEATAGGSRPVGTP